MGLLLCQLAQDLLVAVKRTDDYQNILMTQYRLHLLDATIIIYCTRSVVKIQLNCFSTGS